MSREDPADATPAGATPPELGSASGATPDDELLDVTAVPPGPPWSLDVLADLHAGRYQAEIAGPLRQRIAGDPWAASVLAALDATVDQLSLLPTPRMPERFALRLDAAIAGEYRAVSRVGEPAGPSAESGAATDRSVPQPRQAVNQSLSASQARGQQIAGGQDAPQTAPPWRPPPAAGPPGLHPGPFPQAPAPPPATGAPATVTPATGRPTIATPTSFAGSTTATIHSLRAARSKRRRWVGGLVAAAAVIAIGTVTVASLDHSDDTGGLAAASSTASVPGAPAAPAPGGGSGDTNALQLDPGRFGDALKQIEGKRPAGSLQNAATYSSCLAANTIDPSAVEGVVSATFNGKPAAAIAVTIDAGHSRVVVVGPDCGINGAADRLAAQTVTR